MKFRFGLLPRVVLAIGLGGGCGFFFPVWATRIALTFNDIFGQFLSFVIPLLILGLVAPGIADLGRNAGRLLAPALPFRAGTLPDCERVLFRTGFQTEIRGLCRVHARSLDRLRRDRRTGDHHRVQIRASGCGVDSCGNTETVDHHLRAWPAYRCRTAIEGAGDLLCRSMTTGRCDFLCYGNFHATVYQSQNLIAMSQMRAFHKASQTFPVFRFVAGGE